jgi:transketolase
MRNEVVAELTALARADRRIVLLTADLGFGVVEEFERQHPERFFNVGVAEQGMIATATGLAHRGFTPYCYSIATFASLRGLEFIRNGPVAHRLPVRIIGIGPGFDYENDGLTHYAIDDIAVMRIQPGMTIWAPVDPGKVRSGLEQVQGLSGPVYLRVPRRNPVVVPIGIEDCGFQSNRVCVLSFGDSSFEGHEIVKELAKQGLPETNHVSVTWMDENFSYYTQNLLQNFDVVVCVENHLSKGGFGSAVLESANLVQGKVAKVILSGVERLPVGRLGDRPYLSNRFMSDPGRVATQVVSLLRP